MTEMIPAIATRLRMSAVDFRTVSLSAQTPAFKVIQPPGHTRLRMLLIVLVFWPMEHSTYPGRAAATPNDFAGQVSQALSNVQAVLRGAGMDFGNVVWINIYLTDAHNMAAMDDVYWKMIGPSPPARTVLTVAALPDGEMVEINCIAVADTSQRKEIWPAGWPRGPRADPPAIQAGELLYLSAQAGVDPLTGKLKSDFSSETKQALDNVSTILKAAHMSMKNVLWVNPYFSTSGQYDVMGKVYKTYFEFGNTPGRGTIQVVGLPRDQHIVFSCIAGADLNKRKAVRPRNMPP